MTLLPLMLMSWLALTLTFAPPTVVPMAWVLLAVSLFVVVLELIKPELLVWLPQAMSLVRCPAAKVMLLPALKLVLPWLLWMVAAVAVKLLPALSVRLPLLVMLVPTSWLVLTFKKLAPPPTLDAKSVLTVKLTIKTGAACARIH
jgi:hypothetical protein